MSDAAPVARAASALPLFHWNVVALDPVQHASLKFDRSTGYGYSAGAESIPIGTAEFEAAALSYPIVFTGDAQPVPVVLLGMRQGWNMFVDGEGAWRPGHYVPALVRAYPFAMIENAATATRWLGIEADAACLGPFNGLSLFEDGTPTAVVSEASGFCEACQAGLNDGAALGAALERAGVLDQREATIEVPGGRTAHITGFKSVDPQKLEAVPDDAFLEWRHRNWLTALYAHLFSAASWRSFTELAATQLATLP